MNTEAQTQGLEWSQQESEGDAFAFSFVDMVSGGFGAAFFLFLVFATLPLDSGSPTGGGDRFVELWLSWEAPDETYEAIWEYQPPAPDTGGQASWQRFRFSEGTLSATGEFGHVSALGSTRTAFWSRLLASGFSEAVSPALRRFDSAGVETPWAGLWMNFADPCPGRYRLRINRNAGFLGHLADRREAMAGSQWKLALTAPGQRREFTDLRTQSEAASITADSGSQSGIDAFAPLVALRPYEADPTQQFHFEIEEPRKRGSDLDHCPE